MLTSHAPVLNTTCDTHGQMRAFFIDHLGFRFGSGDESGRFVLLWRDDLCVMLNCRGGLLYRLLRPWPRGTWSVYLWVKDVEALRAEFLERDVPLVRPDIVVKPYGCREIEVRCPDGRVLCFGELPTK